MSPVTADLRNGFIWSDAWGQQYPYCVPVKINWYGSQGLYKTEIWNWDHLRCPACCHGARRRAYSNSRTVRADSASPRRSPSSRSKKMTLVHPNSVSA